VHGFNPNDCDSRSRPSGARGLLGDRAVYCALF
jgi:hypothetical protein